MLIGGDLSRLARRVRPVPALAPIRREEEPAVDKAKAKLELGCRSISGNLNHTTIFVFRVGVVTMPQTTVYVNLVLAGDAILAVALSRCHPS
jgi:hypothetical protein